jgi:hypothetical protein
MKLETKIKEIEYQLTLSENEWLDLFTYFYNRFNNSEITDNEHDFEKELFNQLEDFRWSNCKEKKK